MVIDHSGMVRSTNRTQKETAEVEMDVFRSRMGDFPLIGKSPLEFTLTNIEDREITVSADVSFVALMACDRCLAEVRTPVRFSIDKHLKITEDGLVDEEMEQTDYMIGFELDVERLVYTEVLVNWPGKVLCRDDCKGICKVCGRNLNDGSCSCRKTEPDPRMAAIQDVFKNFKEV